jgi:TRAP-type C4-dicarboxylate transport system permease small subunit
MRTLISQRRLLEKVTDALALIGFAGLVAICLVTMYDGLARYSGLPRVYGLRDFGEVIFAVLIACCFPIGLLRNQNIAITFLGNGLGRRFGLWPTRVLNILAAILTLVAFVVITWALMERAAGLGDRTTRTGVMVVAPWVWAATLILCLAVLIQVWVLVARIAEFRAGDFIVDDHGGATEGGMEEMAEMTEAADTPPREDDRST